MPFRIQRVPVGLNELFKFFGGQTPIELEDRIRGVVDLTANYGSSQMVVASDVAAAGAMTRSLVGTATGRGRLLQMSGELIVGAAAGTQIRLWIGFSPGPAFNFSHVGEIVITAPVAGATYVCHSNFTVPIVFQQGAQFRVNSAGDAAGADHVLIGRHLFDNYVVG